MTDSTHDGPRLTLLDKLFWGAATGVFLGTLAGGAEICSLIDRTQAEVVLGAFHQIMLVYTLSWAVGGLVIALGLAVIDRSGQDPHLVIAQVFGAVAGAMVASYFALWSTYRFGLPLYKPVNLACYMCSVVIGWLVFTLLSRLSRPVLQRFMRGIVTQKLAALASLGIATIVVVAAIWFWAAGRTHTPAVPEAEKSHIPGGLPDVIFILIDTLRADHLPMYGYSRNTAPFLYELSARGIRFDRMYSVSSDTRPSVSTLFSSLYPGAHGNNTQRDALPKTIMTLSEVLRAAGYTTLGISANPKISPTFGFSQGFDAFRGTTDINPLRMTMLGSLGVDLLGWSLFGRFVGEDDGIARRADRITDGAIHLALSRRSGIPMFLYVHYIDPHFPYSPPPPFDRAFRSELDGSKNLEKVAKDIDLYDGEILFTDSEVKRLLETLDRNDMLRRAMVIVTADHGEEFLEHGGTGHSNTLYEEVLHIPYFTVWPGHIVAGTTSAQLVSLVDVMPTMLDLLDLPVPEGVEGAPFMGVNSSLPEQNVLFGQLINDRKSMDMIRINNEKLIRNVRGPSAGLEELFDLGRDPGEQENLIGTYASQYSALMIELQRIIDLNHTAAARVGTQTSGYVDRSTQEALRALGYVE